jgi:hypothetical protein
LRGRLAIAGIIAFAVILGSYLAYMAIHPDHWTLDPVDLGVYRSGPPSESFPDSHQVQNPSTPRPHQRRPSASIRS